MLANTLGCYSSRGPAKSWPPNCVVTGQYLLAESQPTQIVCELGIISIDYYYAVSAEIFDIEWDIAARS